MSYKIFNGFLTFFLLFTSLALAQDPERQVLRGTIENEITQVTMNSVHVLNLNTIVGSISNDKGVFEIEAKPKDTL